MHGLGVLMPMIMSDSFAFRLEALETQDLRGLQYDVGGFKGASEQISLNADADYGHGIALLGTSDALAPTEFFVV